MTSLSLQYTDLAKIKSEESIYILLIAETQKNTRIRNLYLTDLKQKEKIINQIRSQ